VGLSVSGNNATISTSRRADVPAVSRAPMRIAKVSGFRRFPAVLVRGRQIGGRTYETSSDRLGPAGHERRGLCRLRALPIRQPSLLGDPLHAALAVGLGGGAPHRGRPDPAMA